MGVILRLILITCFNCLLVECLLPDLTVKRVDKNFIARKRQDTLDMCKLFNEEAEVTNQPSSVNIVPSYRFKPRNRVKRELSYNSINPSLGKEDADRVEKIVNKLYGTGDAAKKQKKKSKPKPSRRFDFRPALLLPPDPNITGPPVSPEPEYVVRARWKHGIVPYFIDPKTYDAQLSEGIILAFDYVEKATCVRLQKLREKPTDKKSMKDVDWIYITNPTGVKQCVHSNENRRIEGVQMLIFGYQCMGMGDIVHEVMHILGFSHEHLRSDRDQYISILWDNIKDGYRKYFDTRTVMDNQYKMESLPYDYSSILHYPARAFSKNGQLTILTEHGVQIGQREGLSEIDIEKIGLIYSGECVDRNREYLLKTCPTVVKADIRPANVTQQEIEDYFRGKIWPHGIVYYKFKDDLEFSAEERENIHAVFRHIERETCILFQSGTQTIELDVQGNPFSEDEYDNEVTEEPDVSSDYVDEFGNKSHLPDVIPEQNKIYNLKLPMSKKETLVGDLPQDTPILHTHKKKKKKGNLRKKGVYVKGQARTHKSRSNLRHMENSIELQRSAAPGCKCPPPKNGEASMALEISADCFNSVNDLLHFFVHVLGLDHQHNMHDRDSYLHIVWENLTPEIKKEMSQKLPPAASVGFAYDYQSVMHYPWLEIKNGVTNIMYPVWNDGWSMGHWQGLSSTDVQKLNILYFNQCVIRQAQEKKTTSGS